ncbi:MAG: cytochrome c oxidase assembly protein, partial [Alphaproteobacteria bacterium]
LLCEWTGIGGTTQRAATAPGAVATARNFTVRFIADVHPDLPWAFQPELNEVAVKPGEEKLIFYVVENKSKDPIVGTATFNVVPHQVGPFFVKVACFCFEEQRLEPGQRVEMPVTFYVDPSILKDRNMDGVNSIVLSYTFYRSAKSQAELVQPKAKSEPKSKPN